MLRFLMSSPLVWSLDHIAFIFLDPVSFSKCPVSSFSSKIENYCILHKSIKLRQEHRTKPYWHPVSFLFSQGCCYLMPNEFSLSFPVVSKMVCKTILSICLNSAAPAYNLVCASNVDCRAFLAVQTLYQWQKKTLNFFPHLSLIIHIMMHA